MEYTIGNLNGFFDGYQFNEGPITVIIENHKIKEIRNENSDNFDFDGTNCFLSPPFVDGHTHIIFGGDRSFEIPLKVEGITYAEILEKGGGIHNTVLATRNTNDDELLDILIKRMDVMKNNGTLIIEAKSGYGLSYEEEIRLLRILNKANEKHIVKLVPTFCGAHALPSNKSRKDYVEEIISMIPEVKNSNLATSTDVFCDRGAFTVDETRKILQASVDQNLPIRVHAEELEYTGIGKIASEEFHALSVDHLLFSKKRDFEIYAKNNSVPMFMPAAVIGLFSNQRPKGWKNLDSIIGLGSDFNPNNLTTSMQTAIRLAVFLYKMSPINAFKAAISGSYQGIFGKPFSKLKEGELATFNIIQAKNIDQFISTYDLNSVKSTFINGELIKENNNNADIINS